MSRGEHSCMVFVTNKNMFEVCHPIKIESSCPVVNIRRVCVTNKKEQEKVILTIKAMSLL